MIHRLTWDNHPDIYADEDYLEYMSDNVPAVGDTITFLGLTVEVTMAVHIWYPKHNWKVYIKGDDVPKLREVLTYKVSNL